MKKKMDKNFNKIKYKKGFTLIESMVAILIISIALAALISLISSSLFISRYNKNEITANYLLQEVMDFIKNERDTIVFQQVEGGGWGAFIIKYDFCFKEGGCKIEVYNGSISSCKEEKDGLCEDVLLYNENGENNFYGYDNEGTEEGGFRRTIKMTEEEDSLNIEVTIKWKNGNVDKTRSLSTSLMNWYQY